MWETAELPNQSEQAPRKITDHPDVGRISLECDVLTVADDDLSMTMTPPNPPPGREEARPRDRLGHPNPRRAALTRITARLFDLRSAGGGSRQRSDAVPAERPGHGARDHVGGQAADRWGMCATRWSPSSRARRRAVVSCTSGPRRLHDMLHFRSRGRVDDGEFLLRRPPELISTMSDSVMSTILSGNRPSSWARAGAAEPARARRT